MKQAAEVNSDVWQMQVFTKSKEHVGEMDVA